MGQMFDKMKIGILSSGIGAGASLISVCLARALAEKGKLCPAVTEIGSASGLYDALGMDKHFAGKDYYRFFSAAVEGKSVRGRTNRLYDINWALKSPHESEISLDLLKMIRLTNQISGDVIICRISDIPGDDLRELLPEMDRIAVVIDPLPSKMLAGYKLLCQLRASELPIIYIINKMNGGVSQREMLGYLKLRKPLYFPLIDTQAIYSAEYSCRPVCDFASVKAMIKKPLNDIIDELFPSAF